MKTRNIRVMATRTLVVLMSVGLLLGFGTLQTPSFADDGNIQAREINVGTRVLKDRTVPWGNQAEPKQYLYFGEKYSTNYYRILDRHTGIPRTQLEGNPTMTVGSAGSGDYLLLDSNVIQFTVTPFSETSSHYDDSSLRYNMKRGYISNNAGIPFTTQELAAIADTTLAGTDAYSTSGYTKTTSNGSFTNRNFNVKDYPAEGDKCFPLSVAETSQLYNDQTSRAKSNTSAWTTRSAYAGKDTVVVRVSSGRVNNGIGSGHFFADLFTPNYGSATPVSSAFNLDLSKVLFVETVGHDKSYFDSVANTNNNSFKVTLLDESKTVALDGEVVKDCYDYERGEHRVRIPYTCTGDNITQISVAITDKELTDPQAVILYYGNAASVSDDYNKSGVAMFFMPEDLPEEYHAYLLAEETFAQSGTSGASTWTTYASAPVEFTIPEEWRHDFSEWKKWDVEVHRRVCSWNRTHIEKEPHEWDEGKVTRPPTTEKVGLMEYTCAVCGGTKIEPIPKLPGNFVLGEMKSEGTNKLGLSFTKVQGASGYDIFFSPCNSGGKEVSCKKVKTLKGNKTFKWSATKLKKNTPYKAYVKAYVMKDGEKSYVATSPLIHAYTGGGNARYTNPKQVTVKKAKASLSVGKTFSIKAKVKKLKGSKKLISKSHAPALRYVSDNKKVATVSSTGKITAKAKGTCKVYAYAANGARKAVKVTVK